MVCLLYKELNTTKVCFWCFHCSNTPMRPKDILVAGWCGSTIVNVCCSASRTQLRLSSHVPCGPSSCEWYWADVSIETVPRFFGNKTSWLWDVSVSLGVRGTTKVYSSLNSSLIVKYFLRKRSLQILTSDSQYRLLSVKIFMMENIVCGPFIWNSAIALSKANWLSEVFPFYSLFVCHFNVFD